MNLRCRGYLVEKTLNVKQAIPDQDLSDRELVQRIKSYRVDKTRGWGLFVKARNLRPGIDAKEFYKIFDSVNPDPHHTIVSVKFEPTHISKDTPGLSIMVTSRTPHLVRHIMSYGGTGGTPVREFDRQWRAI